MSLLSTMPADAASMPAFSTSQPSIITRLIISAAAARWPAPEWMKMGKLARSLSALMMSSTGARSSAIGSIG